VLGAIARSTAALAASAVWGYAEATRFFVVPDVLIGWVALHGVRPGAWSALAATAGAVLGGAAVHRDAAAQHAGLTEIPGISEPLLSDAAERFGRDGWIAMMRAPLDGIPYKVYAAQSALDGRPLEELLLWTAPARLWRFLLVALGAAGFGAIFGRAIRRREGHFLFGYAAVWAITYVRYYAALRRRYGS
jgi:membrane protein YqaA with SNARE-associated domain